MKQLFIDIETTGLDANASIREIGLVYYENKKKKWELDIKKNIYSTLISTLDGIVDKYNKNDKIWFIGYNAKFDADFIRRMFDQHKNVYFGSYFYVPYVDIMNLAAYKFMRNNKRLENFKLSTVCKYFKIPIKESSLHTALYDAKITYQLYQKLLKF